LKLSFSGLAAAIFARFFFKAIAHHIGYFNFASFKIKYEVALKKKIKSQFPKFLLISDESCVELKFTIISLV
jgi:hypothetical protein